MLTMAYQWQTFKVSQLSRIEGLSVTKSQASLRGSILSAHLLERNQFLGDLAGLLDKVPTERAIACW